jgi:hypothetical protein
VNRSFLKGINLSPASIIPRRIILKILKSRVVQATTIQIEDCEDRHPENRYTVLWRAKDEENRYSARSLQDAEEYYEYRCLLMEQRKI